MNATRRSAKRWTVRCDCGVSWDYLTEAEAALNVAKHRCVVTPPVDAYVYPRATSPDAPRTVPAGMLL